MQILLSPVIICVVITTRFGSILWKEKEKDKEDKEKDKEKDKKDKKEKEEKKIEF